MQHICAETHCIQYYYNNLRTGFVHLHQNEIPGPCNK